MRSQKNLKYRPNQQKLNILTAKRIAAQQKKEQFLDQVMKAIQQQFSEEDLSFLFENIEITYNRDRRSKYHNQTHSPQTRTSHFPSNKQEEENLPREISNVTKRQNLNPFQIHYKEFILKNKVNVPQEGKQYTCTPIRESINFRKRLPKRLFQVDQKMRKNYQRIKQRIMFLSPEESFRATNSIRNSQKFRFHSKTQRSCRYKTECPDIESKMECQSIPKMLLGDLGLRMSYEEQKIKAFDTTQKRLLCFKKSDSSLGQLKRKYKFTK